MTPLCVHLLLKNQLKIKRWLIQFQFSFFVWFCSEKDYLIIFYLASNDNKLKGWMMILLKNYYWMFLLHFSLFRIVKLLMSLHLHFFNMGCHTKVKTGCCFNKKKLCVYVTHFYFWKKSWNRMFIYLSIPLTIAC